MSRDDERLIESKKLSKALLDLRGAPLDLYLESLVERLVEQDAENRVLDGAALYRGQGKSQMLVEIISQAESAEEVMAKAMAATSRRVRKQKGKSGRLG